MNNMCNQVIKDYLKISMPAYHAIIDSSSRYKTASGILNDGKLLNAIQVEKLFGEKKVNVEICDKEAGDNKFVFLSTPEPADWGVDKGIRFVFDAYSILSKYDVILGVIDLLELYKMAYRHSIPLKDVQTLFRVGDKNKIFKLLNILNEDLTTINRLPFVCDKRRKKWKVLKEAEIVTYSTLNTVSSPELLIPEELPLKDNLKGIMFNKILYEPEDFFRLLPRYGDTSKMPRGNEIQEFTYRCMNCNSVLQFFHKYMRETKRCKRCGFENESVN